MPAVHWLAHIIAAGEYHLSALQYCLTHISQHLQETIVCGAAVAHTPAAAMIPGFPCFYTCTAVSTQYRPVSLAHLVEVRRLLDVLAQEVFLTGVVWKTPESTARTVVLFFAAETAMSSAAYFHILKACRMSHHYVTLCHYVCI